MDRQPVTPLVQRQWGVVTRAQLVDLGLSVAAIDARVRRGALVPVHRGVYAVTAAPLRDEGRWLAAVLACGAGAALSHLSAARLWRMRVPGVDDGRPHVTVAAGRRSPRGVAVHRTRRLTRADVTVERGVPVTTPARTIVDCADLLTDGDLRALADHGVRLDAAAVRRAQQRAPGRHGAPQVARLLGVDGRDLRTRSALERRLRRVCRLGRLPTPLVNERIIGRERDAVWRAQRVVVEVDGYGSHSPRLAREDDYARDAMLVAAGWRVLRFTYDQVFDEPAIVAARIAAVLARPY